MTKNKLNSDKWVKFSCRYNCAIGEIMKSRRQQLYTASNVIYPVIEHSSAFLANYEEIELYELTLTLTDLNRLVNNDQMYVEERKAIQSSESVRKAWEQYQMVLHLSKQYGE